MKALYSGSFHAILPVAGKMAFKCLSFEISDKCKKKL